MSNRLTKRSRNTYSAAVPSVAGRPAYCVTTTGPVVKYISVKTLVNSGVDTAPGYPTKVISHLDPFGRVVVDDVQIPIVIGNAPVTICYPAQPSYPGIEAKVVTDDQVGWNSGARSVTPVAGDFDLTFMVPSVTSGAIICGLAPASVTTGVFEAIEHGLYTSGSSFKFYESGVEKHTFSAPPTDQPDIKIRRVNDEVIASVGDEEFRSGTRSTGQKSVAAALYVGSDYIDSPEVTKLFTGSSFAPLSLGNDSPSSRESVLMHGMASGRDVATGSAPEIAIDGVVTVFDLDMAAIDHSVYNDPGMLGVDMSPIVRTSEEFQSGVRFVMVIPDVSAIDTSLFLEASIGEGLFPQSAAIFTPIIFATISESLTLSPFIDLFVGIDARLDEVLMLSTPSNANFILEVLLRSGLVISDNSSQARNDAVQYATNLATGAVTRYTGFGFGSFCRVGQDMYATRPDGLYKIGGGTDNGELLSCLIDFAANDQGVKSTKRLENIFFGIASDGYAYARLEDDFGRQFNYRLIQRDSSEARIDTAKGASSRFWKLRLEIQEASYADVDNIEWVAATGSRRTKR